MINILGIDGSLLTGGRRDGRQDSCQKAMSVMTAVMTGRHDGSCVRAATPRKLLVSKMSVSFSGVVRLIKYRYVYHQTAICPQYH